MAASPATRRFGYSVAIVINAALLVLVNNVLVWDWFVWLTDDFEQVLPLLSLSLAASILVNVVYLFYDRAWFKSASQILVSVIGLGVAVRTLRVFPFDFSAYEFNWAAVARVVLILGVVGITVGIISEVVKLVKSRRTPEAVPQ